MMDREDILKIMEKRVKEVEKKVNFVNVDAKKIELMRKIIYFLECVVPYLLSSLINAKVLSYFNHSAFALDVIKYYENVQETLYSNGLNTKKSSTTDNFSQEICTSTAWVKDELGNFTREEVYYSTEAINEYDVDELLSMSVDELQEVFPIINKKKYVKNFLDEDDLKYNENLVILTKTYREFNSDFDHIQTYGENIFDLDLYLILVIISGLAISKLLVRHRISDKIKLSLEQIKQINNIEDYELLLKIRQENLNLLTAGNEKQLKKGNDKHGLFYFKK